MLIQSPSSYLIAGYFQGGKFPQIGTAVWQIGKIQQFQGKNFDESPRALRY